MPRELITLQIGQCGNQIGRQFWETALEEHARYAANGLFDESMSTFFRNVDARFTEPMDLPFNHGKTPITNLKARAILVDMEEGPVAQTMAGPLGELFEQRQFLTDVSGAGNNWAHGYCVYGPQYRDQLLNKIRHATELCDSLQSFFLLHSMGGGTGSGLGTYILSLLEDHYPDVYRFTTAIFPSANDDVITSPYNSMLALHQLTEHADCVLPVENEALIDLCAKSARKDDNATAFKDMNTIVAKLLTNLTSSMRFEGSLNVDLNEISTNLVPFPRLKFLLSSMSPLLSNSDNRKQPRRLQQMFTNVMQNDHQLIKADPQSSMYLACGLLVRGDVEISDINSNIQRLQSKVRMIRWNPDGFKIGLCSVPPINQPASVLSLSNNCCIRETFRTLCARFKRLYDRRAHLHHYTEFMGEQDIVEAYSNVQQLMQDYAKLERSDDAPVTKQPLPRLVPLV